MNPQASFSAQCSASCRTPVISADFEFIEDGRGGQLRVNLTGKINRCGAITPRFSVQLEEMEYWEKQYLPGKNFGLLMLSTSRGVISHEQARKEGVGGELLGYVY